MKALKYDDEKLVELNAWLEGNFEFTRTKDSMEIAANSVGYKRLSHFLSILNTVHKTPPLAVQYDEGAQTVSVFDPR